MNILKKKENVENIKEVKAEIKASKSIFRNRYVCDFKKRDRDRELVHDLLRRANDKDYGVVIELIDIVVESLKLIKDKHIEIIQKRSKTAKEKVKEAIEKYNKDHGTNYDIYEYQCVVQNLL